MQLHWKNPAGHALMTAHTLGNNNDNQGVINMHIKPRANLLN
jgi:hypothetical protein